MPSIKKRVTGFIRQISGPSQSSRPAPVSPPPQYEKCFIQRYLSGETRPKQVEINHAKTGHGLPIHELGELQPEVFAAYTGPDGGITCITRDTPVDDNRDSAGEVDYIDVDGIRSRPVSRRASVAVDAFEKESARPNYRSDPNKIRVPKSPVYIDNSVMTIRVMDRVYRVDDSIPRCATRSSVSSQDSGASSSRGSWRSSPAHSPSHIHPHSLPNNTAGYLHQPNSLPANINNNNNRQQTVSPMKSHKQRSPGYNAWSGNFATKNTITPPTLSPQLSLGSSQQLNAPSQTLSVIGKPVVDPLETALSYKTSDIIDIDDHLDLVETEDGYLPMSCVSASELSSGRKVISLSSPAKPVTRPSFLDINNQSQSYSSLPNHKLTSDAVASNLKKPFDKSCRISFAADSTPNGVENNTKDISNKENIKETKNGNSANSSYPELKGKQNESSPDKCSKSLSSDEVVSTKLARNFKDDISRSIAGVRHWNRPNAVAYGVSASLYERNPVTQVQAGSPVADTFAVVARKNSAILVLGDGVNWGGRAALASRAAVHGAMDYLNTALFGVNRTRKLTTQDVFQILLRSFHAAHCLIIEQDAMLTTLTAAVVLPTADNKFHFCVCNVGDSLAYVYSKGHVREVTEGSHDITANRDMRDALGALGPVDGLNPELSNLTCSITEVFPGDLVFLTSDGISDNFDPVVGKFCVPKKPERLATQKLAGTNFRNRSKSAATEYVDTLPLVEGYQRHELTLLRIEDILNHDWGSNITLNSTGGRVEDASELCHRMLDFCQRLTTAKRKILEDPELYPETESDVQSDQKMRRRKVCEKLALVPGKLDHATIAAYQVGDRTEELQHYTGDRTEVIGRHTPGLTHAAPHASTEDLTMRESPTDSSDEITPTASISLDSTPLASGASSLAATPTHTPLNSDDGSKFKDKMPSLKSKTENKKFLKELKKKDKKRKKIREKEKEKEKKRAKYRSDTSSESETDESDIDLDEEVYPISHYLNDREEMINQVFSTITGKKLKSMLPPSLVDLELEDLKAICLEQLMGMSKKRLKHVLAGQEMLESSGIETETEDEGKKGSDSEDDAFQNILKKDINKRTHKIAFGKKESEAPVKKKVILSTGKTVEHERSKKDKNEEKDGEDQGKTMMELLELEMRARAIKALLMKAGKDEGEAETLAIEEALDEAKKKEQGKEKEKKDEETTDGAAVNKKKNIRKREDSIEEEETKDDEKMETAEENKTEEKEAQDDRVFNSENKAMSKARQMLMMSENKKMIEDEIKARKEQEALFLYEEQIRKEKMEQERIEREKLAEEAKEKKKQLIEKEQEERRKILEKERNKMIADHKKKEEMKKNKDKEKLLNRIREMKQQEEKEKEALQEHHKTKINKKKDLEEGERLDSDRAYRTKDDKIEVENDIHENISSGSSDDQRRPYDRDEPLLNERRAFNRAENKGQGKTRPKRKIEGGSDVEAGEVEDAVDSDAEDEIDREEDHAELLQKMRNLRSKLVSKAEAAAAETAAANNPEKVAGDEGEEKGTDGDENDNTNQGEEAGTSTNISRARAGRGRRRRGRRGEEDSEWSLKKYDFDAPDIAEKIKDHKPKFVKAPKRVFEKHDGYYSNSSDDSEQGSENGKGKSKGEKEKKKVSKNKPDDGFRKVTKEEWKKMSREEKKNYLKERKKWKEANTKYIKDDSDKEQLTSSEGEETELELTASEDEKEKEERLAKEALKSYAQSFTAKDTPEDYQLVMRKDVWDKELDEEVAQPGFETLEDIEIRDKHEKIEQKNRTKQEKIRADRLRRMQAFQASSAVRIEEEEPEEEEDEPEEEVDQLEENDEKEKENPEESNSFYSSYNEAMQGDGKDNIEDPLKAERLRRQKELEEDEAELAAMGSTGDAGKRRKMAEFQLWKSQRRQADPNRASKDLVDAQQELDKANWEERWKNDEKMKEVFTSSKLVSKAKMKMKLAAGGSNQEQPKKEEYKASTSNPGAASSAATVTSPDTEKTTDDTVTDLPDMIGSVDQYAKILGKSVTELADQKYQPPPAENSESEEEGGSDQEGDLWGAIMGAP